MASLPGMSEGQMTLTFDDQRNDLFRLRLAVKPTSGLWAGGSFLFEVEVAQDYPFSRSKVKCLTPAYHPNIDEATGAVCLNILREDFAPAIRVEQMCQGVLFLMLIPEPGLAAQRRGRSRDDGREKHVRMSVEGGTVHGRYYPGGTSPSRSNL